MFCENSGNFPDLSMQMAGITACRRKGETGRSPSYSTVFQYIFEGEGTMEFDNVSIKAGKGDVLLSPRGKASMYPQSREVPWRRMLVMLQGSLVESLMRTYNLQTTYHVPGCHDLESSFREILDLAAQMKANPNLCRQNQHHKLSKLTFELLYGIHRHTRVDGPGYSADVAKLKKMIDDRFEGYNMDIRELSRRIGKSTSQTIRIFKKEVGITPYEYYLTRKTEAAKLLIANTNASIKEIAYKLNFSDEHYFSNVFKSRTGHAPSHFRKMA